MPGTILATVGAVGYSLYMGAARPQTGLSAEADIVYKAKMEIRQKAEQPISLFGEKANAISDLETMAEEHSTFGWDGDTASPVSELALATAINFIRALPTDLAMPEFAVEPDGSIALEWIVSKHQGVVISMGETSRLAYAWLDGADKGHGVARFDGERISAPLLATLRELLNGPASLRAA